MNYLLHVQALIISILVGIPLFMGIGIKKPIYQGFMVVVLYVILSIYFDTIDRRLGSQEDSIQPTELINKQELI